MSEKEQRLTFDASAYLQRLIGRELISTEELAIVEFVKNSYDAGARHVVITISAQSDREPGEITIRDDGAGMSLDDLKRIFMVAGYSERPDEVNTAPRVPTGEKGIGRFAADKLGHELLVITKPSGAKRSLCLDINWDAFENRKKSFSEITAPYSYRISPELANVENGTFLRITRLRRRWDNALIKALRQSLADLLDPFNPPRDFEIDLQVPSSLELTGPIKPPSLAAADIELSFKILKNGKVKQSLRSPTLKLKQESTIIASSANTELIEGLDGRLRYFFQRPKRTQTNGLIAGVRLYRDGFRVEPFGRALDWLGVAEKKARRAGHAHIVPSHLYGFISISRKQQPDLRHTTSRETLLDGESVQSMITFLHGQLEFLEDNIRRRVTEPRWKKSKTRQVSELERARFQTLSIVSVGLAHELRQPLQAIRSEADNIRQRLEQLHVDDADIREAQESIDTNVVRIDKNIRAVAAISSGSIDEIERIDLPKFISEQCDLFRPRCSAEGIALSVRVPQKQQGNVNAMTVTIVLTNLLQNAIEALQTQSSYSSKQIKVALSKSKDMHVLEVTDNGPGIDEDVRANIFRQFASKKTGGWGVGLYNCNLLVKSHGGSINYTTQAGIGTTFRVELPDASK